MSHFLSAKCHGMYCVFGVISCCVSVHNNVSLPLCSLWWRHNGRDGVSNRQPLDCLLMFRSKETSKLPVTGFREGNSPVTGEFPTQRASNAENVSIWWRHNVLTPEYSRRINDDSIASCINRSSESMILTVYSVNICVFLACEFQQVAMFWVEDWCAMQIYGYRSPKKLSQKLSSASLNYWRLYEWQYGLHANAVGEIHDICSLLPWCDFFYEFIVPGIL